MGCCAAPNCSNNSRNKIYRMFKFPADPERRKIWIRNCSRDAWVPGPNSRLCNVHFEESQFEQNRADNWKKLKPSAIPTLFDLPKPPRVKGPLRIKENLYQAQLNEPQKVLKPVQKEENVPCGAKAADEFILPDRLSHSQPSDGKEKSNSPEHHNYDSQCSSIATISIKEEVILPDDYDWNPTIIEHSVSTRPCKSSESTVFAPGTSGCGKDGTASVIPETQSLILPYEGQQTDASSTLGSPRSSSALPKANISSSLLPVVEKTVSFSDQEYVSERKVTNVVLSSGSQSFINHQILRPEFFSEAEAGSEKSTLTHLPKKRKPLPKTSLNDDVPSMDSSSSLGDSPLSGQSTDQLECFGNYIVSRLRLMDNRTCLLVQKAINDIIFEAEMGKLMLETQSEDGLSNLSTISTGLNAMKSAQRRVAS